MRTNHQIYFSDAKQMDAVPSASVDLVVTSPPYPMIEMWDDLFVNLDKQVQQALQKNDGWQSFESMHAQLNLIWQEIFRVLKPGGIVCINIGDATRTLNGNFMLFPNHSQVLSSLVKIGFSTLPFILWRKQTNAPNKFMGSGMLPPSAYMTLEHEYILIVRKGSKREFETEADKQRRRSSAYFWEERNAWFSDVWMDLKGTRQYLQNDAVRRRSAAFPFELPYRLINMFSVKGDTVLDPFLGTGTTVQAAVSSARNSISFELASGFKKGLFSGLDTVLVISNDRIQTRISDHIQFVADRQKAGKKLKYKNIHYQFPVVTRQETELLINPLIAVRQCPNDRIEAVYSDKPDDVFDGSWDEVISVKSKKKKSQLDLF